MHNENENIWQKMVSFKNYQQIVDIKSRNFNNTFGEQLFLSLKNSTDIVKNYRKVVFSHDLLFLEFWKL